MNDRPVDDPADDTPLPPSKSQRKRDMHALLKLGRALVALPAARLAQLPLGESLREAIELAQRIHSLEGRRRQVHYVGKLMRQADTEAIRAQLEAWRSGQQLHSAQLHALEALREALLADDAALTALVERHPQVDHQALRTRIRLARKEAQANAARSEGQAPERRQHRALFRQLQQLALEDEVHE